MPISSRPPDAHLPRGAWAAVALLWPVAALNYLDRQMLATMGPSLRADIAQLQSAERFGALMAVFLWVYAVCSPFGGWIGDRVNRKWLIVASLLVWSAVTLAMGRASTYGQLYALRGAMGISEALYMPSALALIADFHRGATRSLAIGVHLSGVYMGQALGGIGGWIAQDVSWRAAFQGCGFVGLAYAAALAVLLRESRPAASGDGHPAPVSAAGVRWWMFAALALCFTLPSLPGWAVKNWMPTLLQDRFLMDQKASGLWATITTAGSSFCGVVIGGRIADAWSRRSVRGRVGTSALGLALMAPVLLGMGFARSFPLMIACGALFGFAFGLFDVNNMPILCQVAPERFRATGYGILNFVGIAAGAYVTPLLGRLKDSGVGLATGFALCAIPALVAAGVMLAIRPTTLDLQATPPATGTQ